LTVHHNRIDVGEGNRLARALKVGLIAGGYHFAISYFLKGMLGLRAGVIACFYDDRRYRPNDNEERSRDVLFVGRLIEDKGIVTLLTACERLGRSVLSGGITILGDGPLLDYVRKRKALSEQIEIRILTGRSDDEVASEMRKHRLLVVPSVKNETFGMVVLEGLASGCRVIASKCGGLPEALGECGDFVIPGDADALAQSIRFRLSHMSSTMADQARLAKHLGEYLPTKFVRQCLNIYFGTGACESVI
jgi:glycogen(starch) synthase